MSMQLLVAAFVSAAMVAPAAPAAAPSGPETAAPADDGDAKLKRAEELFNNGSQLFKEGSYEAAILAFKESYELSKLPAILYNIGNAYEKLGDFANARKYLDQYRAFAPDKERELLGRRIQNLDQRLREQEDRARLAREAEADKQPEPADPVAQPAPDAQPQQPTPEPKKDRVFGPAAGVLAGVAVVSLGLGIGFGVSAQSQRNQALKHCADGGGGTFCTGEAQPALDAQRTRALGADISFAVAGAAAIAMIAVIAVKATRKKHKQRAALAPYAGPREAGVSFGMRF